MAYGADDGNHVDGEPLGLFDSQTLESPLRGNESAVQAVLDDVASSAPASAAVTPAATRAVQGRGNLREWQRQALAKYLATRPRDFLAVATPGAGKTTFGLRLAAELLSDRTVDQIIVVAPTEHLKHQWAAAAARAGIALNPQYSNTSGGLSADYQGVVVTYAQVGIAPWRHRAITERRRSLVILDEIHHAGDAKTWGDAVREAYDPAVHRLALTGTPFRSDDSEIPFVTYEPNEDGLPQSRPDHSYGYSQALADGVVRPVVFLAYSGEARWRTSAGEEFAARLGEPLSAEQTARAWRTALDPAGEWMPSVLSAAHRRLMALRAGGMPDAGGLVIASDQDRARAYALMLTELTGTRPAVILSDEAGSSERIESFSASDEPWMVAVRMVSEGVDVPRLAVGVYATSASTPLFFAQAIGRFVRSRRPGETASVFVPSVPVLLDLAGKLENQRDHVIGKSHRPSEGLDDEALAAANRQQDEPGADDERGYEILGAEAELDHLIYDGSTYGTATVAGSAEEQEYLGLPGLLSAEQMRELLRQRQGQQLRSPQGQASTESGAAAELPKLRKELNALVSVKAHRLGESHAALHARLRATCGGPAVPSATAEQIRERIKTLRRW